MRRSIPLSSCGKTHLNPMLTDEMVLREPGSPDTKKALADS
jgi:hypothetical protein